MDYNRPNLKISGFGDHDGGVYDQVTISGSGDIHGDLECSTFKISGAGDLDGNLKADFVKISGAGDINGNVEAEDIILSGASDINGCVRCKTITTSGSSDVNGDIIGEKIDISGTSDVDGNMHAEEIKISGSVDIKGDVEAEVFNATGFFDIDGFLNAGEINIELKGDCRVNEIGCERISVRKVEKTSNQRGVFNKLINMIPIEFGKFEVEVIEGDEIYLEYTEAEIVRGGNVVLGPGCEIGRIEYIRNMKVDEESKAIVQVKVDK